MDTSNCLSTQVRKSGRRQTASMGSGRERSPVWTRLLKLTRGGRGRVGKVLIVHQRSTGRRVGAKQAKSERWFLSRLRTRQERCTLDFDGLAFTANEIGSALVCSSVSTHPLHCDSTVQRPVSTALRRRPNVPLVFSPRSERHRDGRVRSLGKMARSNHS